MRISANTDFFYRSLIYVALHPDRLVTSREIAEAYRLSVNHISKVCKELIRRGYLEGQRGRNGGVRLARPAEEIHLGELFTLDGKTPLIDCNNVIGGPCRISPACRLKGIFAEAQNAFLDTLNSYTLADIIKQPKMQAQLLTLLGSGVDD